MWAQARMYGTVARENLLFGRMATDANENSP